MYVKDLFWVNNFAQNHWIKWETLITVVTSEWGFGRMCSLRDSLLTFDFPDFKLGEQDHLQSYKPSLYVILWFNFFQHFNCQLICQVSTFYDDYKCVDSPLFRETWKTFWVLNYILGGIGHPWHHRSSWLMIMFLSSKFLWISNFGIEYNSFGVGGHCYV